MQFYVILKHDSGFATIRTFATSADQAIDQVLAAELAPKRAVIRVWAKSADIFNEIVCKVDCKFGAPMGRHNRMQEFSHMGLHDIPVYKDVEIDWANTPHFDRDVPLDNGGYDKGGAYWGHGSPLRVRYTKDGKLWEFYR